MSFIHSGRSVQAPSPCRGASCDQVRSGLCWQLGVEYRLPSWPQHVASALPGIRVESNELPQHLRPASQQHHLDCEMLTTKEGSQSGYNQWLLFDEGAEELRGETRSTKFYLKSSREGRVKGADRPECARTHFNHK